jgi:hypothetical protein
MPGALLTEILHPFGRGTLNTTGAVYGTTVSTAGSTSFIACDNATIRVPTNAVITELEVGFTIGMTIATATTNAPALKLLITDTGGTSYDNLLASTTLLSFVSTTNLIDVTYSGRITPTSGTYFTGKGSFDVYAQIASANDTVKATGAVKNSTYFMYSYYLIGG